MQHFDARAQVAAKQRILEDNLERIGKVKAETIMPPIHGQTWGYRQRARLSVRHVIKKGKTLVGFHEKSSRYVADMQHCEILPPKIARLLPLLAQMNEGLSIRDDLPQIEVAVGEHVDVLVLRIMKPLSPADEVMIKQFADMHQVQFWLQTKGPETVKPFYPLDAPALTYSLPEFGITMPFSPIDFTQVNSSLNQLMMSRAMRLLSPQKGERIADFFCGLGNFTLPIARSGAQVVGERPDDLVVYGGTGRAARDWGSFDAITRTLTTLGDDETLLVQSGRPVGVMRTHEWAPRVLIANSNLVGDWATWPEFRRLEHLGLTMYGQMTAGSWIYIGTQGILQGTYETFAAVAVKRFGGTLAGTLTVTGGCGGMGGAQPLAVTMNDGVCLVVDVDPDRLRRRVEQRYLDEVADDLDDAIVRCERARTDKKALSVGLVGNCATVLPELLRRGVQVDVVTDQTSAHDPLSYLPEGVDLGDWHDLAERKPEEFTDRARVSMAKHVEAMVGFMDAGAEVFDYGNSIRDEARQGGFDRAFAFPGFVPAYIRPLFCEGQGPFRWAALSGDPKDIAATDKAVLDLFPDNDHLHRWIRKAQDKVAFQGLPARICWLGYGERDKAGLKFNELVASGEVSAPIVIGRDHLDCGSVASPYRETEAMADGSDAIADWPLLNALVNTASGATWVSIHHGGGVGIGRSIHAGQVSVADGTELAAAKLERVLTNDPGMGVIRHVDAGYDIADRVAAERGVRVPMREGEGAPAS